MKVKTLSIIVPCYNEYFTIKEIIRRIDQVDIKGIEKQLIIVDDGSTDGTKEVLQEIGSTKSHQSIKDIRIVYHEKNKGKGAAIRTAIPECRGEFTIIQDADLEYSPQEWNTLLKPVLENNADVVYGSRFRGASVRALYFWHAVGNRLITTFSNMLSNLYLTDIETCYKLIRTSVLQRLRLTASGFDIEPELTAKLAKVRDIIVYEVPISYQGRTYAEGKKINWKDGFMALYAIMKYNLYPGQFLKNSQEDILANLNGSNHYKAILKDLKNKIGQNVLELGCGNGSLTKELIIPKRQIIGIDKAENLLSDLRNRYQYIDEVKFVSGDVQNLNKLVKEKKFDTIIAFNLLEHVENDTKLIGDIFESLIEGGIFIAVVPAYQCLFNSLDKAVHHYRRYNRKRISELFSGYSRVKIKFFNSIAVLGWYVFGNLLKRKYISQNSMFIQIFSIFLSKVIDRATFNRIGLNILFIAEK